MKKIFLILVCLFLVLPWIGLAQEEVVTDEIINSARVELWFFYQDGCPYCQQAKSFLSSIQAQYPNLMIKKFEVTDDASNRAIFSTLLEVYNIDDSGVPAFFIGDGFIDGYNESVAITIENRIEHCSVNKCTSPSQYMLEYNKTKQTLDKKEKPFSWTTFLLVVFGIIILVAIFAPRKKLDESEQID